MMRSCDTCAKPPAGPPRLIVLTGGPGAGKTAVLEVVRKQLCPHVQVLPEAASILWRGGFPRLPHEAARRAAQRAIVHVQRELERIAIEDAHAAVVLCDRGTVDSQAYWPGDPDAMWAELGTTRAAEVARYAAVIQLRPPGQDVGYNHANPTRTESAAEAAEIDRRLDAAWAGHPRRTVIESQVDFMTKLQATLACLRAQLPPGCALAAG